VAQLVIRPLDTAQPVSASAAAGIAVRDDGHRDQPAVQTAPSSSAFPSREAVAAAVIAVNDALAARSRAVEFAMDPDTRTIIVTLVDTENNQVLRQVPSQEILDIAKSIDRQRHLLLANQA
jgi:flagellar protein FlaG